MDDKLSVEDISGEYWLTRNMAGEAIAMTGRKPREGTFQLNDDPTMVILIVKSDDSKDYEYECYKKHWATAIDNEPEPEPSYLTGQIESLDEWVPVGYMERISAYDYEHYRALKLFDG